MTVIVREPEPPEPDLPEFAEPVQRVVIRPPESPNRARDALIAQLVAEHGAFILRSLLRRKDVLPESAKDLSQRVILVLTAYVEKHHEVPEKVRGFLAGVIRNEVRNHKREWKLAIIDREAATPDVTASAPDPEQAMEHTEKLEKLQRYIAYLTAAEAAAFEYVDVDGMTVDAAAEKLGRPRGSVSTLLTRAREKLEDRALASERATTLGMRRRPAR